MLPKKRICLFEISVFSITNCFMFDLGPSNIFETPDVTEIERRISATVPLRELLFEEEIDRNIHIIMAEPKYNRPASGYCLVAPNKTIVAKMINRDIPINFENSLEYVLRKRVSARIPNVRQIIAENQ